MSDSLFLHLRRFFVELVNFFLNHSWLFGVVGIINRRIGLIKSVTLVYPANSDYALAYVYPHRLPITQWKPWLAGFLWQNNKLILKFVISATNELFVDPNNLENLRGLVRRMDEIRELLGAERKTFAGMLPGILYSRRIIREAPESDFTAVAVVKAVEAVKLKESLGDAVPIIVLGGKGFIGRRIIKLLNEINLHCISIDSADHQDHRDFPCILGPVIIINVTTHKALDNYLSALRPGTIILNEVYPEPSEEVMEVIRKNNCICYHVVGIKAKAVPSFPGAYEGAIPCCTAWPAPDVEVVIKKM